MRTAAISTTEIDGPVWLETPLLRFVEVGNGHSKTHPIIVRSIGDRPIDLEVLAPPLAPFSVIEPSPGTRSSERTADHGDVAEDQQVGKIWIRYDATSPMARDTGQVTIHNPQSGRTWTVELDGSGTLAGPKLV